MERQRNAASQALTEAAKRPTADELAQQVKDAEVDVAIADYEKKAKSEYQHRCANRKRLGWKRNFATGGRTISRDAVYHGGPTVLVSEIFDVS